MQRILEESKVPLYCVVTCEQNCINGISYYGLIASAGLTALTIIISLYNIIMHYIHFNNPHFQSKIIGKKYNIIVILLLPPIFSVTYCFAFWSYTITTYLDIGRCVYQLLTAFAFFYLLFAFLGFDHQKGQLDERKVYQIMRNANSSVAHQFPFSYFLKPYQISNWRKAKYLANRCKSFVFRFIIVKIIGFIILMVFETASGLDYTVPKTIESAIYWVVGIASYFGYYYLILLLNCLKKPLKPFRPQIKFFVIIATIFFVLWQTMVFAIFQNDILACFNKNAQSYHGQKIVHEFEHILICLQMFFVVFVCGQAFSYHDYVVNHQQKKVASLTFIIKDILSLFFTQIVLIKPKKYGFSSNNDKSQTQLQTISKNSKSRQAYTFKISRDMHENRRENYF